MLQRVRELIEQGRRALAVTLVMASRYVAPRAVPEVPPARPQPPVPTVRVLDLHTGKMAAHHLSHPAWRLHHGPKFKPSNCAQPLPGERATAAMLAQGFPATVGELRQYAERYGFKPGAAVRYWAPPAPTQGVASNVQELRLYELPRPTTSSAAPAPAPRAAPQRKRSAPPGR